MPIIAGCCLLLFFGTAGYTQVSKTNRQLTFDFKTKRWTEIPNGDIKKGDLYYLKITGINQNIYNIKVNKKDSTITTDVTFPSLDMLNIDLFSSLLGGLASMSTSAPPVVKDALEIGKAVAIEKTDFQALNGDAFFLAMKDPTKLADSEKEKIKNAFQKLAELNTKIDSSKFELIKKINKLSERDRVAATMLSTRQSLALNVQYLRDLNFAIDTLNNSANQLSLSYLVKDADSPPYKLLKKDFSFEKMILTTSYLRNQIDSLKKIIKDAQNEYAKFSTEHQKIIEKEDSLKEDDKKLKETFASALENADKFFQNISADKVRALLEAIIFLENTKDAVYEATPMQFDGDVNNIEIWIEPRDPKYRDQSYYTKYSFPLRTNYAGIGVSFYYASLKNEAYSIKAESVDTTTRYRLVDEKNEAGEIGVAALLHFGGKFEGTDLWGGHVTIGPAISLSNKIKPRLAIGGGFSYGRKQMATLNILCVAGYVDRLSKSLNLTEPYASKPENATVSKLSAGIALSLGYIYKF